MGDCCCIIPDTGLCRTILDYAPLEVLNGEIVLLMVPVALVTIAEHIGDQMVLSKVAGKNF